MLPLVLRLINNRDGSLSISGARTDELPEMGKSRPRYQNLAIYLRPTSKPRFGEAFCVLGMGEPKVSCEGRWIPDRLPLDFRVNHSQNHGRQP